VRVVDVRELVEFNYWANERVLRACESLTSEQWVSREVASTRTLRGGLVHALDTEWSWRLRLCDPGGAGGEEMREEDFPTVGSLQEAWSRDAEEMRGWVATLSDDDLAGLIKVPWGPEFPMWRLLFHLLSHSTQQRTEASVLLTGLGHSPGDIEFLNFISRR